MNAAWVNLMRPVGDGPSALAMLAEGEALLLAQGLTLRRPPAAPTTCCGRGCNGCVWEGFVDAANYWREDALALLQTCSA
ncbi:oxidoreductase-like domain-containing protein [Limnohabitans sp. B9-3]|uniref:oxidoreductase-like domain-containing protein n=1 Tax=Limnohabitans sp. B9-3 TaxID=1100707 RepID=UPI003510AEDD